MPGEAPAGACFLPPLPPSRGLTKSELSLRPVSQAGSGYTVLETDAGAAGAGGRGQGLLLGRAPHSRSRTLAAPTRPPRGRPRRSAGGPHPPGPAPPPAAARAAGASRLAEPGPAARARDAGLREVRGLDSRRRRRRYVPPEVLCSAGPARASRLLRPRRRCQVPRGLRSGGREEVKMAVKGAPLYRANG